MKKILFILKKRGHPYYQSEASTNYGSFSSGLFNSVRFIYEMLLKHDVTANMVEVTDNNDIDREVAKYRPDVVVIEALWVVPSKFDVLRKLHPNVQWVIRLHSEIPFISHEGVAMDWIMDYAAQQNVVISANTKRMVDDIHDLLLAKYSKEELNEKVIYLPNYYSVEHIYEKENHHHETIDIGCFGAIRPLKNQLIQALAAIKYARVHNKKLRFHINASRVEQGNNVLKNIKSIFAHLDPKQFELVEHNWLNHEEFLKLVAQMDVCLQVSMSETFNICVADAVSQNIPVVVSPEIFWVSDRFKANPTSVDDIIQKMHAALAWKPYGNFLNTRNLKNYNKKSERDWLSYLK